MKKLINYVGESLNNQKSKKNEEDKLKTGKVDNRWNDLKVSQKIKLLNETINNIHTEIEQKTEFFNYRYGACGNGAVVEINEEGDLQVTGFGLGGGVFLSGLIDDQTGKWSYEKIWTEENQHLLKNDKQREYIEKNGGKIVNGRINYSCGLTIGGTFGDYDLKYFSIGGDYPLKPVRNMNESVFNQINFWLGDDGFEFLARIRATRKNEKKYSLVLNKDLTKEAFEEFLPFQFKKIKFEEFKALTSITNQKELTLKLGNLFRGNEFGLDPIQRTPFILESEGSVKVTENKSLLIIIGSDGLIECLSLKEFQQKISEIHTKNPSLSPKELAKKIVALALKSGSKDDISCSCIKIPYDAIKNMEKSSVVYIISADAHAEGAPVAKTVTEKFGEFLEKNIKLEYKNSYKETNEIILKNENEQLNQDITDEKIAPFNHNQFTLINNFQKNNTKNDDENNNEKESLIKKNDDENDNDQKKNSFCCFC